MVLIDFYERFPNEQAWFNRRYWPEQTFDRLLFACIHADPVTLRELKA